MDRRWWRQLAVVMDDEGGSGPSRRLLADGGENGDDDDDDRGDDDDDGGGDGDRSGDDDDNRGEPAPDDDNDDPEGGIEDASDGEANDEVTDDDVADAVAQQEQNHSNAEVTPAGEAELADPKWEKPDLDDIPEFEIRTDEPPVRPNESGGSADHAREGAPEDPTAGMPNAARSPGAGDSRIASEGTEGYVVAVELCARLPEDVRLPEQAADVVPAAVEAELEQDIQSFAAAEFDNPSPHVEILEFVERDDEIWLRLRLGISPAAFADLDPAEIRSHALQELEGLL